MPGLTWTCHVCKAERPDARISVHVTDMSPRFGLPPGSAEQNVRYCNDRQACIDGAPQVRFLKEGTT